MKWHLLFLAYQWHEGKRGFVIFCLLGLAFCYTQWRISGNSNPWPGAASLTIRSR
ncbi:MAG: hypothetical protein JO323_07580 [Acidobacteriia bacterium]|nr:hypothetical protein [Terriglobia bacterium]